MKNLLIPILLLIAFFASGQTYNPSGPGGTPLNRPVALTGKPDGARTYLYDAVNFTYRAFVSLAEANAYITGNSRKGSFYVMVNTGGTLLNGVIIGGTNAAYWWRDGIADSDLVPMITATGSTNTSVGGGFRLAINGTNNIKSIVADLGTFAAIDSATPNVIKISVDTTDFIIYLQTHHPYKLIAQSPLGVNFGLGGNPDTLTCVGCGTGGSSVSGPISWVANIDSVLAYKPSDGIIFHTNEYHTGNGVSTGSAYQWNASSTATPDNHTIYQATAGGTGRWFVRPINNAITLRQLGIFPSSDNTADLITAKGWGAANKYQIVVDTFGYVIDMNAGGIPLQSNINWRGIGYGDGEKYWVFVAKSYTSHGKSMWVRYGAAADTIKNFSFQNLSFDNGQRPNTAFTITGNPDTAANGIALQVGDSVSFKHLRFKGFSNSGILMYNVLNQDYDYLTGDSMLRHIYTNVADTNVRKLSFNHIYGDVGARDHYDATAPVGYAKVRHGDDVLFVGHQQLSILNSYFGNKFKMRWAAAELFGTKQGLEIAYNVFDGNGMNANGLSFGGTVISGAEQIVLNPRVHDNVQQNMTMALQTAADTVGGLPKYIYSNLWEIGSMTNGLIANNQFNNVHFVIGNQNVNTTMSGGAIDNSGSLSTGNESGTANLFSIAIENTSGHDSVINFNINIPSIVIAQGRLMKYCGGLGVIKGCSFAGSTVTFTKDGLIAEYLQPTSVTQHTGIGLTGNIFRTTGSGSVSPAIYTVDALGTAVIQFTGNDVSKLTGTDTTTLLAVESGLPITLNKEGTLFSSGPFSKHMDSVSVTSGNLVTWRNGQAKTSVTLPGGTVNLGLTRTATTATVTNGSGGSPSIILPSDSFSAGASTARQIRELGVARIQHYNFNEYGGVGNGSTDNTAALRSLITLIDAVRPRKNVIIDFPDSVYIFSSGLLDTLGANAIIVLPSVSIDSVQWRLTFRGAQPPTFSPSAFNTVPAPAGTKLRVTYNTKQGFQPAFIGGIGPSGAMQISFLAPGLEDLIIQMHDTSRLTAVNFSHFTNHYVKDLTLLSGNSQSILDKPAPTDSTVFGIIEANDANGVRHDSKGALNIMGFYNGIRVSEGSTIEDLGIYSCRNAVVLDGSSGSSVIQRMIVGWSPVAFYTSRVGYARSCLNVFNYSNERWIAGTSGSSAWYNFIADINDPSEQMRGDITYRSNIAGIGNPGGIPSLFTKIGADSVNIREQGALPATVSNAAIKNASNTFTARNIFAPSNPTTEYWTESSVLHASAIGQTIPGGTIDNDFHLSTYTSPAPTWNDRLMISNLDGGAHFKGRLYVDSFATGSSSDSVLVTTGTQIKKVAQSSISGGGGSGISGLTTNRVPYATSSTTIGDAATLTFNGSNAVTIGSSSTAGYLQLAYPTTGGSGGLVSVSGSTSALGFNLNSLNTFGDGAANNVSGRGFLFYDFVNSAVLGGFSKDAFYIGTDATNYNLKVLADPSAGGSRLSVKGNAIFNNNLGVGVSAGTFPVQIGAAGVNLGGSAYANFSTKDAAEAQGMYLGYNSSSGASLLAGSGTAGVEHWGYNGSVWGMRASMSGAGVWKWAAYTTPNTVLDTTANKLLVIDGSGNVKESSWQAAGGGGSSPLTTNGDLYTRSGGVDARLPIGTSSQHLVVVSGLPAWRDTATGPSLVFSVPTIGVFGAASTYTFTYTTPNDGTSHFYDIGANFVITTTGGNLTTTVGYTDPSSNARTISFFPQGSTSAAVSAAGLTNYPSSSSVLVKANTNIVYTCVTTGSMVANANLTIVKLN